MERSSGAPGGSAPGSRLRAAGLAAAAVAAPGCGNPVFTNFAFFAPAAAGGRGGEAAGVAVWADPGLGAAPPKLPAPPPPGSRTSAASPPPPPPGAARIRRPPRPTSPALSHPVPPTPPPRIARGSAASRSRPGSPPERLEPSDAPTQPPAGPAGPSAGLPTEAAARRPSTGVVTEPPVSLPTRAVQFPSVALVDAGAASGLVARGVYFTASTGSVTVSYEAPPRGAGRKCCGDPRCIKAPVFGAACGGTSQPAAGGGGAASTRGGFSRCACGASTVSRSTANWGAASDSDMIVHHPPGEPYGTNAALKARLEQLQREARGITETVLELHAAAGEETALAATAAVRRAECHRLVLALCQDACDCLENAYLSRPTLSQRGVRAVIAPRARLFQLRRDGKSAEYLKGLYGGLRGVDGVVAALAVAEGALRPPAAWESATEFSAFLETFHVRLAALAAGFSPKKAAGAGARDVPKTDFQLALWEMAIKEKNLIYVFVEEEEVYDDLFVVEDINGKQFWAANLVEVAMLIPGESAGDGGRAVSLGAPVPADGKPPRPPFVCARTHPTLPVFRGLGDAGRLLYAAYFADEKDKVQFVQRLQTVLERSVAGDVAALWASFFNWASCRHGAVDSDSVATAVA